MRCLRPSSRRQCPRLLGGDAAAFCASLVEGLAHLESTLAADGRPVSMMWCADAMRLVKRMQRELLCLFKKSGVPDTADEDDDSGGWFDHYMQETATLLDFCNTFKAVVSQLHRYCMVVNFFAQVGGATGGEDAISVIAENCFPCGGCSGASAFGDKLSDVKAAVSETERLERKIMSGCGDAGEDGVAVAMLVAKITMASVSTFVLQALASPTPVDVGGCTLGRAVPELKPWCESLSVMRDRFPREGTVAEHEKVAMVVRDLIKANAKVEGKEREMVELLRTSSGELKEGIELFDCVLDEVFDEVMKGRNEMLGIFRDKALT